MDRRCTREELYELVWATPVVKLAKTLGVSDVAIAKRCRREGVPVPPRGYWARVAAGQNPSRPSLPPKPERRPPVRTVRKKASVKESLNEPPTPLPQSQRRSVRRYKERLGRDDRIESFWCKLDRWQRSYSFGVNWRPWEYNEESWSELDGLDLFATIRSDTHRPYRYIEAHVLPMHLPRERISRELEAIGNVWTDRKKRGWLLCSAFVPEDSYYSICDAVGRGEFRELVIQVRNLNRGGGSTSEIALRPKLTDLSDE